METIAHWVSQYGYMAIFVLLALGIVGLPVPDESLLTFAGYLAYKKSLALFPAYASALLGSMCGITISYTLGRSLGLLVLHHYGRFFHITPDRINKAHAWFDRFGTWTLVAGYFIPGVRHFTAIIAGSSELSPLHFAVFAYSGALIWTATFIGLGYFFGDQWSQVLQQVQHHLVKVAWGAVIIIAVCLIWRLGKRAAK
jgi:membrane protein DedA with SNARE-associated domain